MPVIALRCRWSSVGRNYFLIALLALVFVPTGPLSLAADAPEETVDTQTGLAIAPDWELAKAHCGVCHSYRLVTANRGDREYWLKTLRWMQRTQNLWPIPPEQEGKLLDYLAANYSESAWGRRPPLSPTLLPQF